ncbi:hypothetical protein FJ425_24880 [Mesorhizobium sp. B2-7-2]|nr:hypothetical protein FJ425_24880 [Mesorhizobium sp. B2-7-2]
MAKAAELPISPQVGEMPGRAEGGAVPPTPPCLLIWRAIQARTTPHSFAPPSVLPDISPTSGEIGSSSTLKP